MTERKAVVLLSGGLDSATVLAAARREGYICHCLSFDYGQRNRLELAAGERVAASLGAASRRVVRIDLDAFGGSALTQADIPVPKEAAPQSAGAGSTIPVTYVPARNTVFLSYALALAEVLSAEAIFIGVNSRDYSGYPDCRPEFIAAFQNLVDLATRRTVEGGKIRIRAPLQHMGKGDIIRMGTRLGVDYSLTLTCYDPDADGLACGGCEACRLRREGFREAGALDPTRYANEWKCNG